MMRTYEQTVDRLVEPINKSPDFAGSIFCTVADRDELVDMVIAKVLGIPTRSSDWSNLSRRMSALYIEQAISELQSPPWGLPASRTNCQRPTIRFHQLTRMNLQ